MKIFSIYGGRTAFWQWDLGQRLIVSDDTCSEVHFDNGTTEKAPVCKVKEENGTRFVDVPNIFLQSDRQLKVYAFVKDEIGQYTEHAEIFEVLQKLKPDDYVYTETEVLTWEALDQRIKLMDQRIKELENGELKGEDGEYVLILRVNKSRASIADIDLFSTTPGAYPINFDFQLHSNPLFPDLANASGYKFSKAVSEIDNAYKTGIHNWKLEAVADGISLSNNIKFFSNNNEGLRLIDCNGKWVAFRIKVAQSGNYEVSLKGSHTYAAYDYKATAWLIPAPADTMSTADVQAAMTDSNKLGTANITTTHLEDTFGEYAFVNDADDKDSQEGKDGIGIAKTEINEEGQLVITYTDGVSETLGKVVGADGAPGSKGDKGETGAQGPQGEKGEAPDAVLYTQQALTPEQQAQARGNIGAASEDVAEKVNAVASTIFSGNIDAAHTNFVKQSVNLFDWSRVQNSRYIGNGGYVDGGSYTCSHPIPVKKGVRYRYYETSITNKIYAYCNPYGNVEECQIATKETIADAVYLTFTADRDGWVVVNTDTNQYKSFMFCEYDSYPAEYVPYILAIDEKEIEFQVVGKKLLHDMGIYTAHNMIDNTVLTAGYLSSGSITNNAGMVTTDYIEIVRGVKYCFNFALHSYGMNYKAAVEVYDVNKQYIGNGRTGDVIWHTEHSDYSEDVGIGVISCNKPGSKYIRITLSKPYTDTAMMVEGDTYPEEYREYGYTLNNMFRLNDTAKAEIAKMLHGSISPLYGKTAVFDGDSICNGGSAGDGLSGWAGRIGSNNAMVWKNYAVGGSTITQLEGLHCIGGNIDTIHSEYPGLDYLILEGGTNDADLLGEDGIGTFSATDYSGNYDTTQFSGALETLLYKAVTYYPTAKIGYIVAHNMGSAIRRTYFDRAVEICKKWGVPCIDLWYGSHLRRSLAAHFDASLDAQGNIDAGKLYTDGQHLTPAGYEVITPKIEAWMKTL